MTKLRKCPRHGTAPHSPGSRALGSRTLLGSVPYCLTCALEHIAITYGGKDPGLYLKPDPATTPRTLDRSRMRYERLRREMGAAVAVGGGGNGGGGGVCGSTIRQRCAVGLYREHGSQAEVARWMGLSRAAVHALLKRAGVI